jgi:hypothetical protein
LKTEPIDTLRLSFTPKRDETVKFRPTGQSLNDVEYWRRWAWPGRWFESVPIERRHLIGKIVAIKVLENGFYYRITSGVTGFDVAFEDVIGRVLSYNDE